MTVRFRSCVVAQCQEADGVSQQASCRSVRQQHHAVINRCRWPLMRLQRNGPTAAQQTTNIASCCDKGATLAARGALETSTAPAQQMGVSSACVRKVPAASGAACMREQVSHLHLLWSERVKHTFIQHIGLRAQQADPAQQCGLRAPKPVTVKFCYG